MGKKGDHVIYYVAGVMSCRRSHLKTQPHPHQAIIDRDLAVGSSTFRYVLISAGNKGKKPGSREDDETFDEAVSTTSWDTNDTASAVDQGGLEANNNGARSDTGSLAAALEDSQAVDDFKDAVEQLSEKR